MKLNYDEIIIIYLLSADLIWTKFVLVKWETLFDDLFILFNKEIAD